MYSVWRTLPDGDRLTPTQSISMSQRTGQHWSSEPRRCRLVQEISHSYRATQQSFSHSDERQTGDSPTEVSEPFFSQLGKHKIYSLMSKYSYPFHITFSGLIIICLKRVAGCCGFPVLLFVSFFLVVILRCHAVTVIEWILRFSRESEITPSMVILLKGERVIYRLRRLLVIRRPIPVLGERLPEKSP